MFFFCQNFCVERKYLFTFHFNKRFYFFFFSINSNENKILTRNNPLGMVFKMKKPEMVDLKNIYLKNISQPTSRDFKRRQFFKKKPYHRAYYLRT